MKNLLDRFRKDPIASDVFSFFSSIFEDKWILREDVVGTICHVIMLYEQNIINEKEAKRILTELIKIQNLIENNQFELNPEFEDIHPQIESMVIEKVGIEIGGKIHSARSRNDQVALDIRLKTRLEILELTQYLNELLKILVDRSEESIDYYCPLYTHLQQGQLGTFGALLLNYAYQISRMINRLFQTYSEINKNPLGACAIGGSSFPINRKRTTDLLAMDEVVFNSIDAISSRDHLISVLMSLVLIADSFTRISEDLIIWSSQEFKFIEIDDKYTSVSSAMPQKKNPDSVELIKGKMGRVYGALSHILFMSKGTPSGYVRDFQESKVPISEAFAIIKTATVILKKVFETMKINQEKMNNTVEKSLVLALDLSEFLSKNTQLSFREAHSVVGALVKKYDDIDKIFQKENIEIIVRDSLNKKILIDQKSILKLKDPKFALHNRISLGSPSPKNNEISIKELKILHEDYEKQIVYISNKIKDSDDQILNLAKNIAEK